MQFEPPWGPVALGVEVDQVAGVAHTGRFADDLAMLFEVLGKSSVDLGIGSLTMHELPEASPGELSAVNIADHQVGQLDVPPPIVVVGAELPSLPAQPLLRARGEIGAGNPVVICDRAAAMGRRPVSDLSVARNEVIKRGLLSGRARVHRRGHAHLHRARGVAISQPG